MDCSHGRLCVRRTPFFFPSDLEEKECIFSPTVLSKLLSSSILPNTHSHLGKRPRQAGGTGNKVLSSQGTHLGSKLPENLEDTKIPTLQESVQKGALVCLQPYLKHRAQQLRLLRLKCILSAMELMEIS